MPGLTGDDQILTRERDAGRLAPDADPRMLAYTLIGSGHLLSAGRRDSLPDEAETARMIAAVIGPVLR